MPQVTFTFTSEGADKIVKGYASIGSAADKAAKQEAKAAQKAAKEREKALKHVAKVRDNYFRDQQRQEDKANAKALKEYEKTLKKRQKLEEKYRDQKRANRSAIVSNLGDAALSGFKAAGALALTGAGIAAGFVGSAARDAFATKSAANRLAINGRLHGQQLANVGELQSTAYTIATNNAGTKAQDVLTAGQGYVGKTGDLDSYLRFADTFAKTAQASGASLDDVANAGAEIAQKFNVKTVKDMQAALAQLYSQGKEGAYELKDLAANLGKAGAAYTSFAGKNAKLGELGGFLQIARTATGGPEQATTAVEDVFGTLKTHQKLLRGAGVNIYDKQGNTKDINSLLVELVGAKGHNFAAKDDLLAKILGREGIRAVNPLISTYKNAYQNSSGTEKEKEKAASDAVAVALENADNASGNFADVVQDAAQAQKDASAQLTLEWQKLESEVSSKVIPAFEHMMPQLQSLADKAIPPVVTAFETLVNVAGDLAKVIDKVTGNKSNSAADDYASKAKGFAEQKASLNERIAEAQANGLPKSTIDNLIAQRDQAEANRKQALALQQGAHEEDVATYTKHAEKGIYSLFGFGGLVAENVADTFNQTTPNVVHNGMAGYGDQYKNHVNQITGGGDDKAGARLVASAEQLKASAAAQKEAAAALKQLGSNWFSGLPLLNR